MVDSVGKPGSGILGGNLRWLGSFDECVDVRAAINQTGKITYPWKGQYCTAHFELQNLGKVCLFLEPFWTDNRLSNRIVLGKNKSIPNMIQARVEV